jgi:hypothetical protein
MSLFNKKQGTSVKWFNMKLWITFEKYKELTEFNGDLVRMKEKSSARRESSLWKRSIIIGSFSLNKIETIFAFLDNISLN